MPPPLTDCLTGSPPQKAPASQHTTKFFPIFVPLIPLTADTHFLRGRGYCTGECEATMNFRSMHSCTPLRLFRTRGCCRRVLQRAGLRAGAPEKDLILHECTDEGFQSQIVLSTTSTVDANKLEALCVSVGWPKRPIHKVAAALENSFLLSSLVLHQRDEAGNNTTTLIGFARATCDGVFTACIWDVLIAPSFQGMGLGRKLVEEVTQRLLDRGIGSVSLLSDARAVAFYTTQGFTLECVSATRSVFAP